MNLYDYEDLEYKKFSMRLTTTKYPMIGVRIPILRKLAKDITYEEYINSSKLEYYEELLLLGMLIPKIKDETQRMAAVKDYIKYIDCWSLCDTFCGNLKFINKDLDKYFNFVISYLGMKKTYYIRFGLVMLLKYAKEEKYRDIIFEKISNITNDDYYVKMGIAWLLCEMAVYDRVRVLAFADTLDSATKKMLLGKMRDSYRIE